MTRSVSIRSFAKINLDLRILHQRPDGYHELRTVFQTISLADTITIEFTPGRRTGIELKSNIQITENLIEKAAELLGSLRGWVRFELKKRIPLGGGLGGGSSNAAAVLLALPVLAGVRVSTERLLDLAAKVGSDVPFFLLGGTALGIGRGTEIYPLPDMPSRPAVIVTPGFHISTPAAYRDLNRSLTEDPLSSNINTFQSFAWGVGSRSPGEDWGVNDFETVVFHQHPQLQPIKSKLLKLGAEPALMSGSGSTLYGIFQSRERRDRAVVVLRKELGDSMVYPVSLMSRSRYRSLWWRQLREHTVGKVWPPQSRYAR